MEYFAGLDVSMAETHVCVVTGNGAVIHNAKVAYSDDVGRAFRLMSATCSDRSRPAVPIDVGRGGGAPAGQL